MKDAKAVATATSRKQDELMKDAKAVAAAISRKQDELLRGTIASDPSSLKAMFHPEFVSHGGFDKRQETPPPWHSADDELAGLSTLKIESNEIKKSQVIPFAQVAIATGVAHTKGTFDGKDISGVYQFIQVWTLNPARIQAGMTSFAEATESDLMLAACVNLPDAV
jgi:hypothetical protein